MIFKRKGFPEVGDLVFCTVKRITPHAAFVELDEYENLEAMLHISEISSRWVKNIKDYIAEGKKIVCKVLDVNLEKNHIDVSLKRVTNSEKKRKINDLKYQIKLEKLISLIYGRARKKAQEAIDSILSQIIDIFGSFTDFYEALKEEGLFVLNEIKMDQKFRKKFEKYLEEQLVAQKVKLKKTLLLSSFEGDGIERIKKVFKKFLELAKKEKIEVNFKYIAAPKYTAEIIADDYKKGEKSFEKIVENLSNFAKKLNVSFLVENE